MAVEKRIQVKPQKQFEIGLRELAVIEEALRLQAHNLSQRTMEQRHDSTLDQAKARLSDIHSVLGNLHNQKVWYVPKEPVPLG